MEAAARLAERGVGLASPNPSVGCIIVANGRVVGRGWTARGGRPHAEAVALAEAGEKSRGATFYVTLEPCAHASARGPACADLLVAAAPARVVVAVTDPDPRTDGAGIARLRASGIAVEVGVGAAAAEASLAGFLMRQRHRRPHVTLKLAMSLDGRIALPDGSSRWITGPRARAHAHVERARADAILVGSGTLRADAPTLDVRLAGLEDRRPRPFLLGRAELPAGWQRLSSPADIHRLDANRLLVEGGAAVAASFLHADLVDRLLLYRAPIVIGDGMASVTGLALEGLDEAHGRWRLADRRRFAPDTLEIYDRTR